jgi:hypothetical protein
MLTLLLRLFLLLPTGPLPAPICPPDDFDAMTETVSALVTDARETHDLRLLLEAADEIARLEAACNGLEWRGAGPQVLGPVDLPAGVYRVHARTEGFLAARIEVIDGECETSVMGLFLASAGDLSDGGEAALRSDGCTAVVALSNVSAPWEVWIEPLS